MTLQELNARVMLACTSLIGTGVNAHSIFIPLARLCCVHTQDYVPKLVEIREDKREEFALKFEQSVRQALELAALEKVITP